jgi:hypothetical protein
MLKLTPTWRLGVPQLYAALLLLAFLSQCSWRAHKRPLDGDERAAIETGRWLWRGQPVAVDALEPPLTERLAAAVAGNSTDPLPPRLPTVFFGLALGGSIWYVARRLYGNAGGYVALALYCFSPQMIARSARVDSGVLAAWGFFGVIFTAIGTAHTLHAPPANRLWRTLLLGLAIGLGTGTQFFVALAVPAALAFMLYLVPGRRTAAAAIAAASLGVGFSILLAVYSFDPAALAAGLRHANWLGFDPALAALRLENFAALAQVRSLAGVLLAAAAVVTYALWPRCRYFGNTAPLLVAAGLGGLALVGPAPTRFLLAALPFAFVFIGGIAADLLESPRRTLVLATVVMLLAGHAAVSLRMLLSS